MAVFQIPISTPTPIFRQRTNLDGAEYVLDIQWNGRLGRWTMALLDQEEAQLRGGITLVEGSDILGPNRTDSRFPPGRLVVVDREAKGKDPGFDDFGTRVVLVYLDAAELAAIGG